MAHQQHATANVSGAPTLDSDLAGLLPVEDLTRAAHMGRMGEFLDVPHKSAMGRPGGGNGPFGRIAQALYRRAANHVLVTGAEGVGKTAVVRELARRAAAGEIPFLRDKRFLWIDCRDVPPEDSRACLEAVVASAVGRPDLVLCLDGLASLLKRPTGGTNTNLLRAALSRSGLQVIGILLDREFNELIGDDARLLGLFTRVEVEEPHEEQALEIVRRHVPGLEACYGLVINEAAAERAVALGASFLLSERFPAKAMKILRRACENVDYERTQRGGERSEVLPSDVVRVVSELSGIPEETVGGESSAVDFEAALSAADT